MANSFYKMYPKHNFAFVKLQSELLSIDELKLINNKYKKDKHYSNIHYLLIDITKLLQLDFSAESLNLLSDLYNTEPQTNNHKTIVWLVSQPLITALTHIFVSKTLDNSKYCSSLTKAYQLLNIPMPYELFEELVII